MIDLVISHETRMGVCVCGEQFRMSGSSEAVQQQQSAWDKLHKDCRKPDYEAKTVVLQFEWVTGAPLPTSEYKSERKDSK